MKEMDRVQLKKSQVLLFLLDHWYQIDKFDFMILIYIKGIFIHVQSIIGK